MQRRRVKARERRPQNTLRILLSPSGADGAFLSVAYALDCDIVKARQLLEEEHKDVAGAILCGGVECVRRRVARQPARRDRMDKRIQRDSGACAACWRIRVCARVRK